MTRVRALVLLSLLALLVGPGGKNAELIDPLPWHDDGVWLEGETHVHFLMLRRRGQQALVSARDTKLDFIVSTEHTDQAFHGDNDERIADMRADYPQLIILAGIEWYPPAGDHANVIVEQHEDEWKLLKEFAERFDRVENKQIKAERVDGEDSKSWGRLDTAVDALEWLEKQADRGGPRSVVYLNHLARKHAYSVEAIRRLRHAGLGGVEAAPRHQRVLDRQPTIDRYDPFIAEIGGDYDQLVADGPLGIVAGSDFHLTRTSYLPGVFSRNFVYAPERSAAGVILGLRRGSTVTVLGGVVERIVTGVETRSQSPVRALVGETLRVSQGARLTYRIRVDVPQFDALGRRNRLDEVEVISNYGAHAEAVRHFTDLEPGSHMLTFDLPAQATDAPRKFFVRCRGRRLIGTAEHDPDNADSMFYVGATHVVVTD